VGIAVLLRGAEGKGDGQIKGCVLKRTVERLDVPGGCKAETNEHGDSSRPYDSSGNPLTV